MRKDIFSGAGLGLLVGVIIGISIAELTGIILGALTSLLAAFFGLRSNSEGEKGNQLVIGSFSFTCVLAIFLGLLIRTHNFLAPSLASQIKEYELASFDSAEIREIILLKEFGIIPEGYSFSKEARQMNRNSILMADETSETYNVQLASLNFENGIKQLTNANNWLQDFRLSYLSPLSRPDNVLINRKAIYTPDYVKYGIETLAARNQVFMGLFVAIDNQLNPMNMMFYDPEEVTRYNLAVQLMTFTF